MKKRQRAHDDALKRVQVVEAVPAYATLLETIEEYAEEKEITNECVTKIAEAEAKQQMPSEAAGDKELKKEDMAKKILKYALRGSVKAGQLGNMELKNELYHPMIYITEADDTLSVARATNLKGLLAGNMGTLTNITAANITEMEAAITAFTDVESDPIVARQTRKAQGTNLIQPLIDRGDEHTDNKRNLIHSYFPDSELEDAFLLASQIIILGTRHNQAEIHLIDNVTNAPITHGTITNVTGGKTATVTSDVTEMEGMRTGVNHYTVTATGYVAAAIDFRILRSVENQIYIRLTPSV